MDEMIYNALSTYYTALEKTGYLPYFNARKMLVLIFIRDFVYHDYRGHITEDDYHLIERALDCLYGTTCLIPYPNYLKMGKLHLGETTEMAQRIQNLEDTNVLKVIHSPEEMITDPESDIVFVEANRV